MSTAADFVALSSNNWWSGEAETEGVMNTGSDPKLTQLVDMVEYEAQLAAGQVHLIPAKYTVDLGSLYDLGKPTVQVSAMKGGRPASKSVSTLVVGGSCLMLDEDILDATSLLAAVEGNTPLGTMVLDRQADRFGQLSLRPALTDSEERSISTSIDNVDSNTISALTTPELISSATIQASVQPPKGPRALLQLGTGVGHHTFSKTWVSPEESERDKFVASTRRVLARFPRSNMVPRTFQEWREHRIAMLEDRTRRAEQVLSQRLAMIGLPKVVSGFGRLMETDGRGSVLSMPTMWTPTSVQPAASAPWPTLQEMKWEGDDRARSGVGRFLPLPRDGANLTVAWYQRKAVEIQDFDQVRKVPTAEEVLLSHFEEDLPPSSLINSDIWMAIDCDF